MIEATHIATLEAWLQKTRDEQNQLIVRLKETEIESEELRSQIAALDEVARQAESMIDSLLVQIRVGGRGSKGPQTEGSKGHGPIIPHVENSFAPTKPAAALIDDQARTSAGDNSGKRTKPAIGGKIAYFERPHIVRSNQIEALSHRFADRTITQACTLLLKESGGPLHVNDLYQMLRSGGMEFRGNNPTISVAVSLNRNRRFRKVAPGTFDLMMREASQAAS